MKLDLTKKLSSGMHIICSPTVHPSVASYQMSAPAGVDGSSSEQVWTGLKVFTIRCHQQERAESHRGWSLYRGGVCKNGALYDEIHCIMGNGHMEPHCKQTNRNNWKHYLPSNFVGGWEQQLVSEMSHEYVWEIGTYMQNVYKKGLIEGR